MTPFKNVRARRALKWGALGLLGIMVLAGIAFGPMLLGYYRFAESVEATSKASTAAGGEWPRRSDACLPCHGVNGNPSSPGYARLAGQPKDYLVQQLSAFASGARANPVMSPLAIDLTAEEINGLADFFSSQPPKGHARFVVDAARVRKGELLAKSAACAACHGAEFQGQGTNPRLAGQGSTYLAKQLLDFKSGARRDAQGVMASIAGTLPADDVESLAQYLATVGVPAVQ